MASENSAPIDQKQSASSETARKDASIASAVNVNDSSEWLDLNNRIRTDLMTHCFSYLQDDDEARLCVQRVWRKYLRCVGDVGMVQLRRMHLLVP